MIDEVPIAILLTGQLTCHWLNSTCKGITQEEAYTNYRNFMSMGWLNTINRVLLS